jgi:hypothetical protein
MRLISIVRSPLKGKKWRATFEHDGHGVGSKKTRFHTDFGASGYEDFTMGASPERAKLYKARHKKDLLTNNPTKAGFLSYYVLWSSPNFEENVRKYKNRFNL